MKLLLAILLCATVLAGPLHAAILTNSADADAFVRSNSPTLNYGGAGSLSVSGSSSTNTASGATNGIADTFIRFNTATMVSNFNALFGANNWVISGAKLQVTEVGTPNNTIFDQGKGAFQIRWTANDTWTEGTGMPNTPTTDGITFNDESTLLNSSTDASLGTFTNTGTSVTLLFPLALPAVFASDLHAGGEVTLVLTALDAKIGFTFNSRSFGTASARPFLEISAVPRPGITGVGMSGTNVVLAATNGAAGGTYYALSSTNVALPLNQWTSVATNVLAANGNFNITATNAANASAPCQQFFILQAQ